jgi:hypothetical protein
LTFSKTVDGEPGTGNSRADHRAVCTLFANCAASLEPPVDAAVQPERAPLKLLAATAVAAYHHSGVTVVSQWYSSGAVLTAFARQNLFTYKNNSCRNFSKYKTYRCDAAVINLVIYW